MPAAASRVQTAPPLAPGRRIARPARPRRVSGPSRAPARTQQPQRAAERGLVVGVLGLAGRLDALASHHLLDRLIRSRLWIGIVAFALIGIVTLQLGLLKLNAGIGRALEREGSLQRSNAALSIENSELATGSRVESQAGQLGMQLASVAGLQFLGSHASGDIAKAAAALRAAPTHEAQQHEVGAAPSGETAGGESEASSEASSEAQTASSGETAASTTGETPGTGAAGSESSTASAGGSGESQPAGEAATGSLPTGEGGGAAAPGG